MGKGGSQDRAAGSSWEGGAGAKREDGSPGAPSPERRTDASDEALMMCVQGGELASLQELVLRYERPLYSFLARYTGDRHLAEDLFQDCFLRVAERREAFDAARGFRPWIYSVAANLARDACRRREVRSREIDQARLAPKKGAPRPDEEAERLEEVEIVRDILSGLPEDARAMVLLHFHQGLTYKEVASALEVPVGTVKSRMHWAVERLARGWNERAARVAASGSYPGRRE